MKSKLPFVLILIGVIIGFVKSLLGIFFSSFFRAFTAGVPLNLGDSGLGFITKFLGTLFLLSFIASIIGLLLSLILVYYLVKLYENPSKKYFIVALILGAVGIFLGMGLIAGILIIIGAIVGMDKVKDKKRK